MLPNNSRNLFVILNKAIRRDYLPAIAAQLNAPIYLNPETWGQRTPFTSEERAEREARWAKERAAIAAEEAEHAERVRYLKRMIDSLPYRVRDRLIDDIADRYWED